LCAIETFLGSAAGHNFAMVDEAVPEALQQDFGVRFEWGPAGCEQLSTESGCVVVVDVLSFTTAVTIATARGMAILPLPLDADDPEAYAAAHGASLAVRRREASEDHPWSLSPSSLANGPFTERLVLPSANGAVTSLVAKGTVVAGCLRNARTVARWIVDGGYGTTDRPALVIAAGERWPDRSLRPAIEDGIGAGAVLATLQDAGLRLSPEAAAMAGLYQGTKEIRTTLGACSSGRELQRIGYGHDVDDAAAVDTQRHVPLLRDSAFTAE
jgi:2-phosphosulfolactate phosphatase